MEHIILYKDKEIYMSIMKISERTGIGKSTLDTMLGRPDFNKYLYNQTSRHRHFKYNIEFLTELRRQFAKKGNIDFDCKIAKAMRNLQGVRK